MILIRLKRRASKNKLSYAIVVTSNKKAPSGSQFIEKIGYYKPLLDSWSNKYLFIDFDRLKFWVDRGARINANLFVLMRAWLIYQSLVVWKSEISQGKLRFYISKKNN